MVPFLCLINRLRKDRTRYLERKIKKVLKPKELKSFRSIRTSYRREHDIQKTYLFHKNDFKRLINPYYHNNSAKELLHELLFLYGKLEQFNINMDRAKKDFNELH